MVTPTAVFFATFFGMLAILFYNGEVTVHRRTPRYLIEAASHAHSFADDAAVQAAELWRGTVRAKRQLNTCVNDNSRKFCLQTPVAASIWFKNYPAEIRWTNAPPLIQSINIDLLRNGVTFSAIASTLDISRRSFPWAAVNVDNTQLGASYSWSVKIWGITPNGTVVSETSPAFQIGGLAVHAPFATEMTAGGFYQFSFTPYTFKNASKPSLQLFRNGVRLYTLPLDVLDAASTYTWAVPVSLGKSDAYQICAVAQVVPLSATGVSAGVLTDCSSKFPVAAHRGNAKGFSYPSLTGRIMKGGTTETIQWSFPESYTGVSWTVDIYSVDASTDAFWGVNIIKSVTANATGTIAPQFKVPSDLPTGSYYLRSWAWPSNARTGLPVQAVSNLFRISQTGVDLSKLSESMTIRAPSGSSVWNKEMAYNITFVIENAFLDNVDIDLYADNCVESGNFLMNIAQDLSGSTRWYTWTVPDTLQTARNYCIKVSAPIINPALGASDTSTSVLSACSRKFVIKYKSENISPNEGAEAISADVETTPKTLLSWLLPFIVARLSALLGI